MVRSRKVAARPLSAGPRPATLNLVVPIKGNGEVQEHRPSCKHSQLPAE